MAHKGRPHHSHRRRPTANIHHRLARAEGQEVAGEQVVQRALADVEDVVGHEGQQDEVRAEGEAQLAQDGFGVFSVCKSHASKVTEYIKTQRKHHEKQTFEEEYVELLTLHEIEYDERYLFG